MTLGPTGALPTMAALREEGRLGVIQLATFDVAPEVLDAILAGHMLFAIDQQPFLQGYLPIVLLYLHESNLNQVASDIIRTGPSFLTKGNVAQFRSLADRGTR